MDCGSAPAAPCVGGGGCDQPCPLRPPPYPEPRMPSRRAGGQWAGMEGSDQCSAVTQAVPDDCHHLGVLTPPTRTERENETQGGRSKDQANAERQMDGDKEGSNETEWE